MKTIAEQVQNHSIEKYDGDLAGKKILLRIDVNTSLGENGAVDPGEDWRIIKSLQTIEYLIDKGASIILISHIGREPAETLKPIFEYMQSEITLGFLPRYDQELIKNTVNNMRKGDVVMMENVRQFDGEKKNNSSYLDVFVENCDVYINDAFSVSHREHASVHNIAQRLPSYFGLQFCQEVLHLQESVRSDGNTVLLLGGAKFGTKLDLLEQLLPKMQYVLVGGALANVFLRERGFNIGASFADADADISGFVENEKILIPVDGIDQHGDVVPIDQFGDEDMILDIGPETESLFETILSQAHTVLWNGPMGKYEDGYTSGSIMMADAIAKSGARSVTGGGDTATVILEEDLADNFDFISTGGGAMLDFLVAGTLPGIQAILEKE